jgi:hypothetical protein
MVAYLSGGRGKILRKIWDFHEKKKNFYDFSIK